MQHHDRLLRLTVMCVDVIAGFWVVFALHWLFRGSDYRWFYAVSGVGYAVVLALLAYFLNRRERWAWWAMVVFLGFNVLLTFADQVGWFDLVYLIPSIVVFVLAVMAKPALTARNDTPAPTDRP